MSPAATCLSSDRVSPLLDNILEDPPQRRWRRRRWLNSHCLCRFAAIRSRAADKCNNSRVLYIYILDIILYYIMHVCLLYNNILLYSGRLSARVYYAYLAHRNVRWYYYFGFFFLVVLVPLPPSPNQVSRAG